MPQKKSAPAAATDDRLVVLTRVFDASRDRVFKAWTDPESLTRWYAPRGCTVHFSRVDVRQDGGFHSCIRTPDGHDGWCKGVYLEIVAPSLIVYTLAIADENGNLVDPVDVGMDPDWPRETIVTVTFAEEAGKTMITLRQTVLESIAKRTGAHPSWIQRLDRLAEDLALRSGGRR